MYGFEVEPAFCGATYSDELQMVHADTGAPVPFLPAIDDLVWRLMSVDRQGGQGSWRGYGYGDDYGFSTSQGASLQQNQAAVMTLSLGAGLYITSAGTALWTLSPSQTYALWRSRYRMTLDLVRYGEVCRVLDTTLPVER